MIDNKLNIKIHKSMPDTLKEHGFMQLHEKQQTSPRRSITAAWQAALRATS